MEEEVWGGQGPNWALVTYYTILYYTQTTLCTNNRSLFILRTTFFGIICPIQKLSLLRLLKSIVAHLFT
jgi:hypothetical protein